MMLVIFIFLVSILILSANIKIHITSMNDTIKSYMKIGIFYFNIPHRKILSNFLFKKINLSNARETINHNKGLIFNILSHSILDRIYIAKYSKNSLTDSPIENGIYLIVINQLRTLLQRSFKFVNEDSMVLQYDECYENIDYYLEAHLSVISLSWASIKTILKR